MKTRKKIVVLKENNGPGKSTFYLPRLRVPHNYQCEVAVHFIYHCKINSVCMDVLLHFGINYNSWLSKHQQ